mmetsp:Transcript_795/g.1721  ORF Transcript_795/g.1721 Transcript_795/m.1721 type:complete len:611 (+) Transcript_795:107-1939(+)
MGGNRSKPPPPTNFIGKFRGPLQEKYDIVELLGKGAQGAAYLVKTKDGKREYVAKETKGKSERERKSLMEEFERMRELGHPHCVKVMELVVGTPIGASKGKQKLYIISELAKGSDLCRYIDINYREKQVAPSEAWLAGILKQAMLGVNYIHSRGYVHNDLKPDNILVLDEFESRKQLPRVVIADYGCMTVPGVESFSSGDPRYQSPQVWEVMARIMEGERLPNARKAGPEADIWSMGVTLYELISGGNIPFLERPCSLMDFFEDEESFNNLREGLADPDELVLNRESHLPREASPQVRDLLGQMLRKDASERITGKALLDHDWFSENLDQKISPQIFRRLKFQSRRGTVHNLLRNALAHQLQRDHYESSWKAFQEVDKDHSGTISKEEFRECYQKLARLKEEAGTAMPDEEDFMLPEPTSVPNVYRTHRPTNHGMPKNMPSLAAAKTGMGKLKTVGRVRGKSVAVQSLPDTDFDRAFEEADVDGDECLNFQEFTAATFDWESVGDEALQQYLEQLIETLGQKDGKKIHKREFKSFFPTLADAELNDVLERMDDNKDGFIDYDELRSFLFDTEDEAQSKLLEKTKSGRILREATKTALQALGKIACCTCAG